MSDRPGPNTAGPRPKSSHDFFELYNKMRVLFFLVHIALSVFTQDEEVEPNGLI